MKSGQVVKGIEKYFVLFATLLLVVALILFASPFLSVLLISAIIVTAIYPIYKWLHRKKKIPANLAAFITLILTTLIIIAPFTLFFFLIANETSTAVIAISQKVSEIVQSDYKLLPELLQESFVGRFFDAVNRVAPVTMKDIASTLTESAGSISSFIVSKTTGFLAGFTFFILQMIVFFLSLFYFIRDGDKLVAYLYSLIPVNEKYRKELFHKLFTLSYGIIYGLFGAAIAQGLLLGIGFNIVDVSNPVFWGTLAAIASPIPYIGTAIIWVPWVISLFVAGKWLAGVFLMVWCMAIVGLADNLVKPYLIGSKATLNPLAVLIVILGGTIGFGFKGFLFSTFILTVALSFLHIYQLEYKKVLASPRRKSK